MKGMDKLEKVYAGALALVSGAGAIGAWLSDHWLGLISTAFGVWASIEMGRYYRAKRKGKDDGAL